MKNIVIIIAMCLLSMVGWANTYVHYSTDDNTEWCQIYNNDGKWIGAFKVEWKDDSDAIGEVTLYNWSEKWGAVLKPASTKDDKHIYLKNPPKEMETLDLALSTSKR